MIEHRKRLRCVGHCSDAPICMFSLITRCNEVSYFCSNVTQPCLMYFEFLRVFNFVGFNLFRFRFSGLGFGSCSIVFGHPTYCMPLFVHRSLLSFRRVQNTTGMVPVGFQRVMIMFCLIWGLGLEFDLEVLLGFQFQLFVQSKKTWRWFRSYTSSFTSFLFMSFSSF